MDLDHRTAAGATAPEPVPVTFEVTLPGDAAEPPHRLAGDLYLPSVEQPDTVQLLLSGLTYDRRYWTAPGTNSYVDHMVAAGHAVLALDRLGTGASGHPAAEQVTVDSNVETVHQVVQALRAGHAGRPPFRRVVAVGHSLGSGVAVIEAARHGDLDALVLTGLLHAFGPLYPEAVSALYPTALDELLAAENLPDGYLTTRPEQRAFLYEYADGVEKELSAYHEETKSTVTIGEGFSLDAIYQPEFAAAVAVPVLIVAGAEDGLFGGADIAPASPATVTGLESGFYTQAPTLDAFVVPQAAHALNVHRTAPAWYAAADAWLSSRA